MEDHQPVEVEVGTVCVFITGTRQGVEVGKNFKPGSEIIPVAVSSRAMKKTPRRRIKRLL
jgi:hypothetical protein